MKNNINKHVNRLLSLIEWYNETAKENGMTDVCAALATPIAALHNNEIDFSECEDSYDVARIIAEEIQTASIDRWIDLYNIGGTDTNTLIVTLHELYRLKHHILEYAY